jgi:hypothetical protein
MNTVLWIFIALAFGFMLFVSLQPQMPEGLSWLKNMGADASEQYRIADGAYEVEGWKIVKQGTAVELTKSFSSVSGDYGKALPLLGIMCSGSSITNIRIDPFLQLPPGRRPDLAQVQVGGLSSQMNWYKTQGNNVVASPGADLVGLLKSSAQVQFRIQYPAGPVMVAIDSSKFAQVAPYLANCTLKPKAVAPTQNTTIQQ